MSSITVTDKAATAYRNRRAAEIAAERAEFAASCNRGMESLSVFVSKFRVELACGTIAGLVLFGTAMFAGLI